MTIGRTILSTVVGVIALVAIHRGIAEPSILMQDLPTPLEDPERDVSLVESSTCDLSDKIAEAMTTLSAATPKLGTKKFSWTETRNGRRLRRSDYEKEFALVVLHIDTCENELVTITKRGGNITAPEGWVIAPVERSNGILFNHWNTEYSCEKDGNRCVVVGNVEPFKKSEVSTRRIRTADGLWKVVPTETRGIDYRMYVPYSQDLHSHELVREGQWYLSALVDKALDELRRKQVPSRAFPGELVADLDVWAPEIFERLPLIEQMDMGEFLLEPERVSERVYILFGGNEKRAFGYTCSSASACGAMQFTDNGRQGTYSTIRKRYPSAELIRDFGTGARDHLNSMQAAILLHDNNLAYFRESLAPQQFDVLVLDRQFMEETLASAYNTGAGRTAAVLYAHFGKPDGEWTDAKGRGRSSQLLTETKGYIVKLRWLFEQESKEEAFEDI